MRKYLGLAIALVLVTGTAHAYNVKRQFNDFKMPTQQMVEKQTFTNPIVAGTSDVASALTGPTASTVGAAVSTTSGLTNPDMPRNLVVTPGGTTGDVEDCIVTVTGTNAFGVAITEAFRFEANASAGKTGTKAFKTVTQVDWNQGCESGAFAASWSIGVGEKLGLTKCMANAGDVFHSLLNGAKEATGPTMLASGGVIQWMSADFNGTMDGANDFVLYFMQNFSCHQ